MEECIFENICPAAPARLSHTVLSTKLGEGRDHRPLPSHHLIPSSLVLPEAVFSISIHLVTILKGTLLAHYMLYLPLKYMVKIHTDLAKRLS